MMPEDIYDPFNMYDKSNEIHPTAIIYPGVKMGKNNVIGAYTVIGSNGEIRGTAGKTFQGTVEIGDGNIISELVTIQKPLEAGKVTKIGNNNILMAHCHIGHDAEIMDDTEICTSTVIGGYAWIKSGAKIKLLSVIRNRIVVGFNAIVGMGSVVVKHVDDGAVVFGNPAREKK